MKRTATFLVMLLMATAGFAQMHKSRETVMEKFKKQSLNFLRSNAQKAETKYLLDSAVSGSYKTEYTYNAQGKPVTALEYFSDGQLYQKRVCTYDANGNVLTDARYAVTSAEPPYTYACTDSMRITYNANSQPVLMLWVSQKDENNEWIYGDKTEATYYPDGNVRKYDFYEWDKETHIFGEPYGYDEYFDYTTAGNLTFAQRIVEIAEENGVEYREEMNLSLQGNTLTEIWREYENSIAGDSGKSETTFDTSLCAVLERSYVADADGNWVVIYETETTSDNEGNISIVSKYRDNTEEPLREQSKQVFVVNPSVSVNNVVNPNFENYSSDYFYQIACMPLSETFYYNDDEEGWFEEYSITYYYTQTGVGINNVPANTDAISVYPNPTTGLLRVGMASGVTPDVKLYSIGGALLLQSNSAEIDITGFASGIYIICVNREYKKVVKR